MPGDQPITIVYCLRNIDRATYDWLREFERKNPEIILEATGCLCNCSRCVEVPFLMINGRLVEGSTHAEIIEEILAALQA